LTIFFTLCIRHDSENSPRTFTEPRRFIDGFPVAHHVFRSGTADVNAFWVVLKDRRQRFSIRRVIVVADWGVVSEDVVEELERAFLWLCFQ
jgi:hypothetical protein